MQKKKSYLSVFQMTIMTTITVASLRGLPAMAIEGKASIIMYLVPAILFLVPTALVGAELASTYQGGIYVWVKEAFGNKWGFLAIWLQWIQNVVWYPIQLAFVAAALAFAIGRPDLSNSGLFTTAVIIIVYWLATFFIFTRRQFVCQGQFLRWNDWYNHPGSGIDLFGRDVVGNR
ncbi:MAG: amino acid permease [Streptococcus sp.]